MLLGDRLSGIVTGSRDTLILYISAHGVSDDGEPYLLCSDFLFRRQNVAGRYPLAKLFNQVQRCPAKLKLLILDAGGIEYDPRLGMVVNEFPRLVDAQLRTSAPIRASGCSWPTGPSSGAISPTTLGVRSSPGSSPKDSGAARMPTATAWSDWRNWPISWAWASPTGSSRRATATSVRRSNFSTPARARRRPPEDLRTS